MYGGFSQPEENSQELQRKLAQEKLAQMLHPNVLSGLTVMTNAVCQTANFLSAVLSKVRSSVAAVFPQVDNITAQVSSFHLCVSG